MLERHFWTYTYAQSEIPKEGNQELRQRLEGILSAEGLEGLVQRMSKWTIPPPTEEARQSAKEDPPICNKNGSPNSHWLTTHIRQLTIQAYDRGEPFVSSVELDVLCTQFALLWCKDHSLSGPVEGHTCGPH